MKKFIRLSLLLSLAIVLNIIEASIPFFSGQIPGLRLGLANIITLFVLYQFSFKDAIYLAVLRVFLVGILRTGIFSTAFFMSLTGVIISLILMYIAKKIFSEIGVSIIGAVGHSIGQILTIFLISQINVSYYLPFILFFSIISGIITGIICKYLNNYFKENLQLLYE